MTEKTEKEVLGLLREERSLTEHIDELERQRKSVRASLTQYVVDQGPLVTPDWKVRWQAPTTSQRWDNKALKKFEEHLLSLHPALASALASCRTENERAGYIKIEPNKEEKEKEIE